MTRVSQTKRVSQTSIATDKSGATIVEFALVTPVLMTLLLGLFDVSYNMYANAILEGAMQEAGRNSTIEAADTGSIDAAVTRQVRRAVGSANLTFKRNAYAEFSDVSQPEDYTDINGDGSCNDGEPYEDANGNGSYDLNRGATGQGGARNAVVLTATMTFDRFFPIDAFTTLPKKYSATSSTVLRNQPYDINENPPATENCV